ncbi:hypothetical protein GOP47_0001340 [Adiantum capillus-veneris]|uniref:Importin-9 n=1 Tax=Adiantum capillus-veneris TaxID=13818 RepID=A0A9D4V9W2_ADICA|nr:hypothetical protein GOP47_0001340 [Adiantum capillus-veneris]
MHIQDASTLKEVRNPDYEGVSVVPKTLIHPARTTIELRDRETFIVFHYSKLSRSSFLALEKPCFEFYQLMEGQQLWLANCLNATLDIDYGARKAAEDALNTAATQPGYGVALAKLVVDKGLPFGLRQISFHFCNSLFCAKALCKKALAGRRGELRSSDCSIRGQVNGALKCLSLFAGDLDDIHVPRLVPILFPSLYIIVSTPQAYGPSMRRRALIILHGCISTLGVMSGVYQSETKALVSPMLKAWMEQFALILSSPVPYENPDDWGIRMEALKILLQMVLNFSKLFLTEFSVVLSPLWSTLVSCLAVYDASCIQGVQLAFSDLADSDGNEQSLESFCVQLLELLTTMVGHPRCSKIIKSHIGDLAYFSICYMQMTSEQVETWSSDVNVFAADEEDVLCSCRVSGALLLEELVSTFELAGVQSIVQSVERRFGEAAQVKASGRAEWWKVREAALLAIGTVSDALLENHVSQMKVETVFNLEGFLDSLLLEDLNPAGFEYPFLYGRALWVASKLSTFIDERRCEQFLKAAVAGLGPNSSAPIRVCACRSLLELLPIAKIQVLHPHMEGVMTSLCNFMQEVSEETLHLTLDTLQTAIKADPQTSWAMESKLSPLVLGMWRQYISDPFVSMDALEILEALKDTPGCLESLVSRVLPFVGPVLANPSDQAPGLVAGTVDLLNILIKKSSAGIVQAVYNVAFAALIGLVLRSDDHSELQNATECLATFVQEGGETMLSWSGDAAGTMRMLLDASARLLNPELDSSSSLFVERLISQLILKLPGHMAPHLKDLVVALVQRMETSEIMGLRNSLILVIARLVHMSAPDVGQLLNLLVSIPAKNSPNSLEYVMSEWTKHQGEMQGAYQIKVTTTALALILSSRHSELSKMHVQGRLIQLATSGIMTRSRAKEAPEQWTLVPLPVKLLSLMVSAMAEMQEQRAAVGNEDDDWEEVEDGVENDVDDADDEPDVGSEKTFGLKISGKLSGSSVFKPLEDMQHLLTDELETGDYKEDPCAFSDPINQINLVSYLSQVIKKLAADDPQYFSWICQGLLENEMAIIQGAMAR